MCKLESPLESICSEPACLESMLLGYCQPATLVFSIDVIWLKKSLVLLGLLRHVPQEVRERPGLSTFD